MITERLDTAKKSHLPLVLAFTVVPIIIAILLKLAIWPYVWIFAIISICCFVAAARGTGTGQNFLIIVASIFSAMSIGEAITGGPFIRIEQTGDSDILAVDPNLGWRAIPNAKARVIKAIGGETVYDVLYTIDTSGFRISSPNKEQNGIKNCMLLMGDSFTFGEGVMDEETYPYKVGLITKGSTRTINLGLTGYGPHHMLALIESSSTVSSFKCTPSHVIYLAIPHHVSRVAGKAGRSGPRYIMSENGGVHRQGTFGVFDWNVSSTSLSERIIRGLKNRSNMLRFWNGREPLPTDNDLKLFSSIVRRLRVIGGDLWPDAKFHILSWNVSVEDRPSYPRFRTEIQTTGWEIHDIHEAFPGYWNHLSKFRLHRYDVHPTAYAYSMVAQYVVDNILSER